MNRMKLCDDSNCWIFIYADVLRTIVESYSSYMVKSVEYNFHFNWKVDDRMSTNNIIMANVEKVDPIGSMW